MLPFVCTLLYHRAYNTYLVLLILGTSLWASTTTRTQVRVYNSIHRYMTLRTEHFTCSIFGTTTTAVTTAVVAVVVVVLTLTYRYNAVRGHRTGSNN